MTLKTEFVETLRNMTNLIIHLKLYRNDIYMILLNDSPLNMTIHSNEIAKIMGEVNSDELESITVLSQMIYQTYKCRFEHTVNDWNVLKETIYELTREYYNENELEKIIVQKLPIEIRQSCYYKGMSNDSWLEEFKTWAEEHLETKIN